MSNTAATDEETIAQRRKRLRRVSFADREITSVHIFNRDEDDEKPQHSEQSNNNTPESAERGVRFFGELADGDDTEGDCDAEEDIVTEKSFLRPRGSPSSGGSTIGSATSDDDDNFFGPVSSHFINPGRFSDVSAASEEHHDITMDSTAFSMHFRSLAMSEEAKTPTSRSNLQVDELAQASDTGSAMALTGPKKFFLEPTLVDNKGSGGSDSNDMSIIGENSRKYDYGRISPGLAALLGEESNVLPPLNGSILIGDADKDPRGSHSQIVVQESGSQHYTKEASLSSSAIEKQRASLVTPSPKQGGSFMSRGTLAVLESLSTIQKSKSRLGLISPGSALSQRIEKSKLQLSKRRCTPSTIGKEVIEPRRENHLDIPITNLEDLLSQDDDRTPVSEKKGTPNLHSSAAFSSAVDISDVVACKSPEGNTSSEIEGSLLKQQQRNQTANTPEKFVSSPANSPNATIPALKSFVTLHDQEKQSETIRSPEAGDGNVTNGVFASTSPEGNTGSEIEGSLLEKQQRNQTATTPEKFVSSPAKSPNATIPALKSFVTLHDQEQQRETMRSSETGYGNADSGFASNNSTNTLSDKIDSLPAESDVLLTKTGFLNGYAQQKGKDNANAAQLLVEDKNQSEVLCEEEVIPTEDVAAIVTRNLPATFGFSSMDRNKNQASHEEGSSRLKRKAEDVDIVIRNCSPRVGKRTQHTSNPVMENSDENSHANDCSVDIVRKQAMNWIEVPGKVSVEINQRIAPLADKLNSGLICKLEDILTHLKKVHLFEMLCLQIQSQKVCDELSAAKAKRRSETKSLLCKLAYEKAKLELLHLKQEIMMKKYEAVSTGVQTSKMLTLHCAKLVRQHRIPSTRLLNPEQSHEVTTTKGAELTEEVKILDSKIENLIKCFPTCDETTREHSYADTITIAEDNLRKKMNCRSIRQQIVVWEVDSLGESNECQSIVLNYSGLIKQRLTLKPGHASCVLISNRLIDNDNKVVKNFPGMNVSAAFNSLFNADYSEKYVGGLLLEITQKTSLLVHNLLDVAEELQLARMEIPNLVQASFDSPSREQLHLRISFIDCESLTRVTMILDVTCLIHGKYPGEVLPSREFVEISDGVDVSKELMSEVESVMVDVGFGYPRILRLCNCISKVLRSQQKKKKRLIS